MPIVFDNVDHGYRLAKAIPRTYHEDEHVISKVTSEGKLLGGVIYTDKTSNCIFMHQASFSPVWLTGDMLWVLFHYPFVQLGVDVVAGTIPSTDEALYRLNLKYGFTEEARIKNAYKDGDLVIMTMRKEQCRWLNRKPKSIASNI